MKWNEVRKQFPDKWLLFAAIESHITNDEYRIIDELAPIHAYTDFYKAWDHYSALHAKEPVQRLYVYHTSNDKVNIKLQHWADENTKSCRVKGNHSLLPPELVEGGSVSTDSTDGGVHGYVSRVYSRFVQ